MSSRENSNYLSFWCDDHMYGWVSYSHPFMYYFISQLVSNIWLGYENPTHMRNITDAHCYQNMLTSSSNSTISRNVSEMQNANVKLITEISTINFQDQFRTDCEGNITSDITTNTVPKSKYDNKECTVGEQLFLSNQSQSNDNLIDSTAGSCDPLFANQSLEQINLGSYKTGCPVRYRSNECQVYLLQRNDDAPFGIFDRYLTGHLVFLALEFHAYLNLIILISSYRS